MNSGQQFLAWLSTLTNSAVARVRRACRSWHLDNQGPLENSPADNPFAVRPRVMVVDDVEVNRLNVAALLSVRGIKPVQAADGAEAVALACGEHFDLILMDMQMPILDGLAASAQIRCFEKSHGHSSAPIVAYSSGEIASDEPTLRAHGIDDSLEKPCTADSLEACLSRWCTNGSRPMRTKSHAAASAGKPRRQIRYDDIEVTFTGTANTARPT